MFAHALVRNVHFILVVIYDRPLRRVAQPAAVPTEEERNKYVQEAEQFTGSLRKDWDDPFGWLKTVYIYYVCPHCVGLGHKLILCFLSRRMS